MSDSDKRDALTLQRWSRRKLAAARAARPSVAAQSPAPPEPVQALPAAPIPVPAAAPPTPLPPVDSLTIDSDFAAFLRPDVDETLRRGALRKLFSDARFNVMDGLDVYIDDYSKPDPLPAELVRQLAHARYIFDPPATRVNAAGEAEDVPAAPDAQADPSTTQPADSLAPPAPAPACDPPIADVTADVPRERGERESK